MRYRLYKIILLSYLARLEAKEPELPLCPTNMQYFPQNLPMHCRLPISPATLRPIPGKPMEYLPPTVPGFPNPIPGSVPGMIPGPMPMPMAPMAPIPQSPAHKLPVVVMPFYSPDTKNHKKRRFGHKKRPKHFYRSDDDSSDTDASSDDSSDHSSEHGWWERSRNGRRSNRSKSKRRRHKNKDLLTPVLQYVTKDGYVIFEKQISKGEANNWLGNKKSDVNKKGLPLKNEENPVSKESRDDNRDTKLLMRDEENVEVKTENSPRQIHQKKFLKRKASKKHTTE
ncbi:unnamed protein product [Euphydryas editha]|uniref:Uncharacterized protein n=1 Tax=Euphydryas editha TaxID=104508 RepID=A0AAU9TJJ3_EUPED|nr:unnamed protein product [Euphydryas editha]